MTVRDLGTAGSSRGDYFIRTLRGVGGLNTHNKDLVRPIKGSIVPYPPPPTPLKGSYDYCCGTCAIIRTIATLLMVLMRAVVGLGAFDGWSMMCG